MKWLQSINWLKIGLFNFLIVSFLGLIMRYKIGFSFPFLDQKNIQQAHSHFAFSGWVSLVLMVLLVKIVESSLTKIQTNRFNVFFVIFLFLAYGSIISFSIQGYGIVSIIISVLMLALSFYFNITYFLIINERKDNKARVWIIAALLFSALSAFGTAYLSYMMASKNIEQQAYLASVYWYLHFQYNGWFFFGCAGLFIHYLQQNSLIPESISKIFWLFAISCLPGYGLSILWMDLPIVLYIIICVAAIAQFYGVIIFLIEFKKLKPFIHLEWSSLIKFLFLFVGFALFLKLLLQLGSVVPALAKFAFGFRPIVIAYLHLVLLAFTSLFLIAYTMISDNLVFTAIAKKGILFLSIGVLLNEIILSIQGIGSLNYTLVPYANEMLFAVAIIIFISLLVVNLFTHKKNT